MKRGAKKILAFSLAYSQRETWDDIRNRITYGTAEWRIVRLHQLVLTLKKEQATAQRGVRPKWAHENGEAQNKSHFRILRSDGGYAG